MAIHTIGNGLHCERPRARPIAYAYLEKYLRRKIAIFFKRYRKKSGNFAPQVFASSHTGSAVSNFTCFNEKLERILSTPGIFVK
jgi:hypothetical protein